MVINTKRLVLIIALLFCYMESSKLSTVDIQVQDRIFSESKMIALAKEIGIKYIDVMIAQSRLETAWYSSDIFHDNKNLFGMKVAKQRETTAIGVNRGHAQYHSWIDSLKDYKLWQDVVLTKVSSRQSYISYIGRVYAEDGSYLKKINKQLN
jgi:uncharacterized FlgJ-related protein